MGRLSNISSAIGLWGTDRNPHFGKQFHVGDGQTSSKRLYREEGLTQHQPRKRRRRVAKHRRERFHPDVPNRVWLAPSRDDLSPDCRDSLIQNGFPTPFWPLR